MSTGPQWLLDELPRLQRDGIVNAETAQRLRAHYAAAAVATQASGWGRILSATLGGLLIGMGVILLVAHNWDSWPRILRVAVSLAPLLAGQLACIWALTRARGDVGWQEGAAAFTATAFAAALALVGQLYHFSGDLDRYLLTCTLAALPLVYLLNASTVAVLCTAAITVWAAQAPAASPLTVLLLLSSVVPHVALAWRRDRGSARSLILLGVTVPLSFVAILVCLHDPGRLSWLWLAEFSALLWLVNLHDEPPGWRRPLPSYGLLGLATVALSAGFTDFWQSSRLLPAGNAAGESWLLLGAVLALLLWLMQRALRADQWLRAGGGLPALLLWLTLMFDPAPYAGPLALLSNLYLAVLGIALIRLGVQTQRLRTAHAGLLLLAALILARFFDSDWSFTVRGIAFMVIGAGCLAISRWLRQRVTTT